MYLSDQGDVIYSSRRSQVKHGYNICHHNTQSLDTSTYTFEEVCKNFYDIHASQRCHGIFVAELMKLSLLYIIIV